MCSLYAMTRERAALLAKFRIADNRAPSMLDTFPAIRPSTLAPVVKLGEDGERELLLMNWGYVRKPPVKVT